MRVDLWVEGDNLPTKISNFLSNSMNYLWIFEVKYCRPLYVLVDHSHFYLALTPKCRPSHFVAYE
jgi:hypothetical protein